MSSEIGYPITVTITDPEAIAYLKGIAKPAERVEVMKAAFVIGIRALKSAKGDVDRGAIKEEVENLLKRLEDVLRAAATTAFSFGPSTPMGKLIDQIAQQNATAGQQVATALELSTEKAAKITRGTLVELHEALRGALTRGFADQQEFHAQVRQTLAVLDARKEEAKKGTQHGFGFETDCIRFIGRELSGLGSVIPTGDTPGKIPRCKIGDVVVEMGEDSAAPGARIVVEVKQSGGYTPKKVWEELAEARKNRGAEVGLFVMSERHRIESLPMIQRQGSDVYVSWNCEEPESDSFLRAALLLCTYMLFKKQATAKETGEEIAAIEQALILIMEQLKWLPEMQTQAQTIVGNGEKIKERCGRIEGQVTAQVEKVKAQLGGLR